ncbi:MAG: hypothetical protein ACOCVR_01590, partial [Myxococcota bacterium]
EENDDHQEGGTDSRLVHELGPGEYQVVASTYQSGETGVYEIETRTVAMGSDPDLSIPSRSNWLLGGRQSQPRGPRGTLQDRHILHVEEAKTLQIDMRSDSFDTYLILLTADGTTVLAENDDAGQHTTDASLIVHVRPGRYQLAATSYQPGEEGLYELELSEVDASTPGAIPAGPP